MSELTFPCPLCKQNISCNASVAGEKINCPHCLELILVPPAGLSPTTAASSASAGQKTSGLAIASLVCSLASVVTCIGWLPGIICGHIAKARIRRDPALKGSGIATAGLVIGYLFLLFEVSYTGVKAWQLASTAKGAFAHAKDVMATNPVIIAQTTPTTTTATAAETEVVQAEPGPETATTDNPASPANAVMNVNWTTDLNKMTTPDQTVSGMLHGNSFQFRRAYFRSGVVRIVSTGRSYLEVRNLGDMIDGKSFQVQVKDPPKAIPHLILTWPEGVLEPTAFLTRGYAMKLEFGPITGGTTTAKIYICLPDNSKSALASTFQVEILKTN